MRVVICFVILEMLFSIPVSAQPFDVRAYSRQRGFKAYQPKPETVAVPRQPAFTAPDETPDADVDENRKDESFKPDLQEEDNPSKIQQTGIKVFQKKDEGKVLNFDVENPEFDKLSDKRKQDIMNRITFEKDGG